MDAVQIIEPWRISLALLPVLVVMIVLYRWSLRTGTLLYALVRMLGQLILIGYALTAIFATQHAMLVLILLLIMITAASWIALRTVKHRRQLYGAAFLSILLGSGAVLFIVTQWVIVLTPWYQPHYLIALGGMVFANAMNSVSLAAERMNVAIKQQPHYAGARNETFNAAFIPAVNALFAVGLVSLPGMMTGQILSGVDPVIAAHYQIVVMCMIVGSAGLSTMLFLTLSKRYWSQQLA